ncbi:hypothetical protein MES4922_360082 [Mesorhizobium ventifaucium]|uniref:Uncharacterized protein n=2 Tax=Mesorhizobium TaxID=68287 RepID=A0ABM9E6M0_9HYPH|nr:hypothetical protein MES4922_360082 [Mesorhizobium ventifaucium]CAH2407982.1 hypothetical protein MES5069_640019 [Mesorhizobium escarrei]
MTPTARRHVQPRARPAFPGCRSKQPPFITLLSGAGPILDETGLVVNPACQQISQCFSECFLAPSTNSDRA